jgi:hypothetical protein
VSDVDIGVVDSLKVLDPHGRLEKKREPVSDVDIGVVDSLKVLDPHGRLEKRPNFGVGNRGVVRKKRARLFGESGGASRRALPARR